MACINDDWEHHVVVNPILQDLHCGDEEYFATQDVSTAVIWILDFNFLPSAVKKHTTISIIFRSNHVLPKKNFTLSVVLFFSFCTASHIYCSIYTIHLLRKLLKKARREDENGNENDENF